MLSHRLHLRQPYMNWKSFAATCVVQHLLPLPSSTQWEITEAAVSEIMPVYLTLVALAAQGKVIHNDDTKLLCIIQEETPQVKI